MNEEAIQLLDYLDDKLFVMLRRPVDANDIADVLEDVRKIRDVVIQEEKK